MYVACNYIPAIRFICYELSEAIRRILVLVFDVLHFQSSDQRSNNWRKWADLLRMYQKRRDASEEIGFCKRRGNGSRIYTRSCPF